MRCPQCERDGETSTITVLPAHKNNKQYLDAQFFDENGEEHFHDPALHLQSYQCSRSHFWTVRRVTTCWCGWQPPVPDDMSQFAPGGYTAVRPAVEH